MKLELIEVEERGEGHLLTLGYRVNQVRFWKGKVKKTVQYATEDGAVFYTYPEMRVVQTELEPELIRELRIIFDGYMMRLRVFGEDY